MKKCFSLLPFFIFLSTFVALNLMYPMVDTNIKSDFPIFAAFIAICIAFFTFKQKTPLNDKIKVFIQGTSQPEIIHLCFIFLFSTILTYVLDMIGGTQAAIDIALYCIPQSLILPGIFIITSLFSMSVGTSMGTIVAFMPIFYKIALELSIDPALVAGIVMSGAMFGDNLSLLSDTTIAACNMTGSTMINKFKDNLRSALPAAALTVLVLGYINYTTIITSSLTELPMLTLAHFIKITPYLITFALALASFDILFALVASIFLATSIGIYYQKLTFVDTTAFFYEGFYKSKGMVAVTVLVLFLSGLSQIIQHNGGITYLLNCLDKKSKSLIRTKFEIFALVFLVNCAIAINTISIILAGPVAVKLADNRLSKARIASLLDIGSCISQGILPYTPQDPTSC